jgi:polyisoprenoid-binding protein YceI
MSVFRFDKVQGRLQWNPEAPASSTLEANVATVSISTPVPGFAKELAGDGYLRSARFPEARFVSKAFHQTDGLHGTVAGEFTLMGVTKPLTFDATLQGAGKGFMGHPRIGITAKGAIRPQDFGLGYLFDKPMPIEIDAEFQKD